MLLRLKSTCRSEFSGPCGADAEVPFITMFVFMASTFFWVFLDPNESFLEVKTGESASA